MLALSPGSAPAELNWVAGVDGAWEVPTNWQTTDDPPINRLPIDGEWIRPRAAGVTITYSDTSGTNRYPGSTIWQDANATTTFLQTGGDLEVNQIYLAKEKANINTVNYRITGGRLFVNRNMNMTWSNSGSIDSRFVQAGGFVRIGDGGADGLSMCIKNNGQKAYYDFEAGEFAARNVRLCQGGNNSTAVFTQNAGTIATINSQLQMGATAGTSGGAIYRLDGGQLTIQASVDPLVFTQPGAPVYFEFAGGALNLRGTWEFAVLTAIPNSDFRALGEAGTADNLVFTPVTIDTVAYTQITARPPSPGMILVVR